MPEKPPENVSKEELWNRLRRLEKKVYPDRRDILKGAAGVASLGAAGMLGRASAAPGDDGETVWGGPNNRDSYYADEIDANVVSTGEATIGNAPAAKAIDDSTSLTWHEGELVAIPGDSYETIFNINSSTYIQSGTIYGPIPGFRLTVDGTVVADRTASARGNDDAGNYFGVIEVPSADADSSIKLEAFNQKGTQEAYGWRVVTL